MESALADAGRVSVLGPLLDATDVQEVWDGLDPDRRRAVIDTLIVVRLDSPGRGVRTFNPETVALAWW